MLHHRKTTGQGTFLNRSNPELIARFKKEYDEAVDPPL